MGDMSDCENKVRFGQERTNTIQRVYSSGMKRPRQSDTSSPARRMRPFVQPSIDNRTKQIVLDEIDTLSTERYTIEIYNNMKISEASMMASRSTKEFALVRERKMVVDWVKEVAIELLLQPETLFLTINYYDRILGMLDITTDKLQLYAVTCLLIASKYEEINPPAMIKLQDMTDDSCKVDQIMNTEYRILTCLKYQLTVPTVYAFLSRLLSLPTNRVHFELCNLARSLAEFCLSVYTLQKYPPSMLAASIVFVVREFCKKKEWNVELEAFSGYTLADIRLCVHELKANPPMWLSNQNDVVCDGEC
eukprot:TRINITY_DN6514_c0_g1_i1.p1 TRINITY_DN6514_c0_g1~~TRINITY_DN6514_c0_g1_i1.p1  ORF type:complete len:306 (+),score=39.30 TRINITY_DN6514_c0_g1_i1:26-943(+)